MLYFEGDILKAESIGLEDGLNVSIEEESMSKRESLVED